MQYGPAYALGIVSLGAGDALLDAAFAEAQPATTKHTSDVVVVWRGRHVGGLSPTRIRDRLRTLRPVASPLKKHRES